MGVDFYKFIVAKTISDNNPYFKVYDGDIPEGGELLTPFAVLKNFGDDPIKKITSGFHCYEDELEYNVDIYHMIKNIVLTTDNPFVYHERHQDIARIKRLLLDIKDFQPWAEITESTPGKTTNKREGIYSITTLTITHELIVNEELGITSEQSYFDTERFDLESEDA